MKQKKLTSILAVTISLELMVTPIIASAQGRKKEGFQAGLQALGNIWNQANRMNNPNGGMSPQMVGDMQKLSEQMQPQPDKYFNPQRLSQIPGLGEYLAKSNINPNLLDCKTLPTTLHDAKPEVCRLGLKDDRGIDQGSQLNQMFTYHNQYFQINKMYKNFTADSNSAGQAFGIGCMNNAMNILNGFFNYRMDELDKLTTNFEAMQNELREKSRLDLDAIEEAVAVLDGDSDMADKVRSKKPDLFDFSKRFNNPACNSMFSGEKLNDLGRGTGLNSINRNLKEQLTQKVGRYSGESYSQSHAAVLEDINSVADKISKQVELNFNTQGRDPKAYGDFLKNVPGSISSVSGVNDSIRLDMFSDVQTKYTEKFAKLAEEQSTIASELEGSGKALNLLGSINSANFEAEVNTLENNVKNGCLKKTLGSATGSRKDLMDKIYDPSGSKHANKYASNFLKDKLNQILDDDESTIEKKLADLKALEAQQGNRYYMKMENSYEVQDVDDNGKISTRIVDASSNRSPSVYFSDIIKNCNAQFRANKLKNKLSGAGAIQRLRQLNSDFKTFAKTQAGDIKKEIRKKLIECSGPEVANNTVPGSCSPQLFNPSAPGFCANAAFSCSKNMQACSKQAEGFVKEIRDQKTARVNNYKALVQKNKQDIVKIFDSALARYMKDGEALRGMFGAGFSSPVGIEREVSEGQRYLTDFKNSTGKGGSPDGKLLLEDPDKYAEMFKKNIDSLKTSVSKQQEQILGGNGSSGLLADHVKKTMKNLNDVAKEANTLAGECIRKHDEAIARNEQARQRAQEEFAKTSKELGEKQREFCQRFNQGLGGHPGPACEGNIGDLVRTLGNSANDFANYCDATQNTSSSTSNPTVRATTLCIQRIGPRPPANSAAITTTVSDSDIDNDTAVKSAKTALKQAEAKVTNIKAELADARQNMPASGPDRKARLAENKEISDRLEEAEKKETTASTAVDTKRGEARTRLTKDLNERNATQLAEQQRAQKAARDAAALPGNTTPPAVPPADQQLIDACAKLMNCQVQRPAVAGNGTSPATLGGPECIESLTQSYTQTVLNMTQSGPTLSVESAPAFCNAGDNSGPGNFTKGLQIFSESLAGGTPGQISR
jgi:hypothetical protein